MSQTPLFTGQFCPEPCTPAGTSNSILAGLDWFNSLKFLDVNFIALIFLHLPALYNALFWSMFFYLLREMQPKSVGWKICCTVLCSTMPRLASSGGCPSTGGRTCLSPAAADDLTHKLLKLSPDQIATQITLGDFPVFKWVTDGNPDHARRLPCLQVSSRRQPRSRSVISVFKMSFRFFNIYAT